MIYWFYFNLIIVFISVCIFVSIFANPKKQKKIANYNKQSILSPAHSRSSSTTSSSGYCNSNSLSPVQSNKVSPVHSRTNSATIMDDSQNRMVNFDSLPHYHNHTHMFIDNNNKENIDETDNHNISNNKQSNGFFYKTMNGNIIRSVQPPGKGLDSKYKVGWGVLICASLYAFMLQCCW